MVVGPSVPLAALSVLPIKAEGQAFNPAVHEAISSIETDEGGDGMVVEEMQRGYMLHDRLLRPSVVIVGKKPVQGNQKIETGNEEEGAESSPT